VLASAEPQYSPYLAQDMLYSKVIGGISAIFETMYPGIADQTLGATFVSFLWFWVVYKYKIVSNRTIQISWSSCYVGYCSVFIYILGIFYVYSFVLCIGNSMMSIGISIFCDCWCCFKFIFRF
jgi:hypothetical protein